MKIKQGYKIRKMCGNAIVVAVGNESANEFNGMITLNETGELLWEKLSQGAELEDLTALLMSEYGIDEATAKQDAEEFVGKVKGEGFLE